MAISLTTITGASVSGLTSPTYDVTADVAPNPHSKQWAVTSIGGTQTGVDAGSTASRPWTLTFTRPQSVRQLNAIDNSGVLRTVPMNEYGFIGRKGMTPLTGQASKTSIWRFSASVPAGADTYDIPNLKAAGSSFVGALNQQISGFCDTMVTGVL